VGAEVERRRARLTSFGGTWHVENIGTTLVETIREVVLADIQSAGLRG
jgi:hypothetical protein